MKAVSLEPACKAECTRLMEACRVKPPSPKSVLRKPGAPKTSTLHRVPPSPKQDVQNRSIVARFLASPGARTLHEDKHPAPDEPARNSTKRHVTFSLTPHVRNFVKDDTTDHFYGGEETVFERHKGIDTLLDNQLSFRFEEALDVQDPGRWYMFASDHAVFPTLAP